MKPLEIAQALRSEGREEMALGVERMIIALRIAAKNMWGTGLESLKPMSVEFGNTIGDMCADAADGEPHDLLDEAVRTAVR
jgi:hypothetical protein